MVSPPPLNLSLIGLLCYFKAADSITLNDCLPALLSYTQYGNYIEGIVRTWDTTNTGADSPYRLTDGGEGGYNPDYNGSTGDTYLDVHVRIRADGWILAYMLRTDDRSRIIWWGAEPRNISISPTTYSTRIGRAVQIIMAAAGIGGFAWASMSYYDYEYTAATRLWFFGKYQAGGWNYPPEDRDDYSYFYALVPNGLTVLKALMLWIYRGKCVAAGKTGPFWCGGYFDGTQKYYYEYNIGTSWNYVRIAGGGGTHPAAADITSLLTTGTQHSFGLRTGYNSEYQGGMYYLVLKHEQAAIVWTT